MENLLYWKTVPAQKAYLVASYTPEHSSPPGYTTHVIPCSTSHLATPCQPERALPWEARSRTRLHRTSSVPGAAPPPAEAASGRGIQRTGTWHLYPVPSGSALGHPSGLWSLLNLSHAEWYFPRHQKSLRARPMGWAQKLDCCRWWTMGSLCSRLKCNPRGHKSSMALTHFAATCWVRSILESLYKDNKENGLMTCSRAPLWMHAEQ